MLVRGIVAAWVQEGYALFVACACCPPLDASCHHGFAISVESRQLFEGVGGVRGVDVLIGMRQVASDLECSWCHRLVQCPSWRLNWSTDGFIISSCLFHTSAYIRDGNANDAALFYGSANRSGPCVRGLHVSRSRRRAFREPVSAGVGPGRRTSAAYLRGLARERIRWPDPDRQA